MNDGDYPCCRHCDGCDPDNPGHPLACTWTMCGQDGTR